jgi:hypothetical protein
MLYCVRRHFWRRLRWGGAALIIAATGCADPLAHVSGSVSLDGQPLPGGRVTFLCDGKGRPVVSSPISASGRYEIPNLPVGQAKVAVQTFKPRPKPEPVLHPVTGEPVGDGSEDTGGYVPIPGRYAAPQSSGLEYTLRPGEQTFDIVLGK